MNPEFTYPDKIEIKPLDRPVNATIRVPPSKSISNRAMILAALSDGHNGCQLENVLDCEDTQVMVAALRDLGFRVHTQWDDRLVNIRGGFSNARIPSSNADLFIGNSGTAMRFLTAMLCLGKGRYRIDGVLRMRERPMGDLLDALTQLGAGVRSEQDNSFPPIIVDADGLMGGICRLRGTISSQFMSAVLMAAPFAHKQITIFVEEGLVSQPYVAMTIRMMADVGVIVDTDGTSYFKIPKQICYRFEKYAIEPDASSASYLFAAAAISRGIVYVDGLKASSFQGDMGFLPVLDEAGCKMGITPAGTWLQGDSLRGIDVDMNAISDTVMTLAAVACFADGPTTIRNVAHIRHKECDRIRATATELRKLGVEVEEFSDGMKITPQPMHGAELDTYNDHRMAMSLALIGLRVPGVVIKNPGCVAKTYPGFWQDFELLYG